ncbi:hypothetical protein X781_3920 [Mannheimia sp. USDA-ARS-USMARC-1261]|uniref:hypothetical protein n=1 Tax=Mannheimia sp. USDA-ARS-USMARC-1261 TaxID=1432056 RepID=UPI0003E3BDA1|nr:hypothetical protein [Mannheimia sp. USDA-ARS-USMARC-1261]AHG72541.1 hypothetical protein X781_3920 [Mannheimia sp. USDA-ARS-USMARC-1261]
MSDININKSKLEDLINNSILLMDELEKIEIKGEKPFKNIRATKFAKWLKKVKEKELRGNEDKETLIKIFSKIYHYSRILNFVKEHQGQIKTDTLRHLISGSETNINDAHKSEDYFFEIDVASRFKKEKLNLLDITDIIVNDNLFIECKKLHSIKKFEKNIKDANKQLDKIPEKSLGFIALDFTDVFNKDEYFQIIYPIITFFREKYSELEIDNFKSNPHFRQIISTLLSHSLEFQFNLLLNKLKKHNPDFKFNKNVIGIFYQLYIPIQFDEESLVLIRGATYSILKEDDKELCKELFLSLATGF